MSKNIEFEGNSASSRDIAHHLHSYTHPETLAKEGPHIINKGDGIYVYDDNGEKYIEGMSGLWCTSLGFSEEEIPYVPNAACCRACNIDNGRDVSGIGGGGARFEKRRVLREEDPAGAD